MPTKVFLSKLHFEGAACITVEFLSIHLLSETGPVLGILYDVPIPTYKFGGNALRYVFLMFNCSSKSHITLFIGCFHTQHGNLSTHNANLLINE